MGRFDPDALPAQAQALAHAGRRIGLLGGSFNPAHDGHRHISLVALRRFGLDQVWWLVSPQNPLKDIAGMAPLADRVARARLVADHPRIAVSCVEKPLGTRYTVDTVWALRRAYPAARFVWLVGGDNLAGLHQWRRWDVLMRLVPVGVIGRPGFTVRALGSKVAGRLAGSRTRVALQLADRRPPAWAYVEERLDPASATGLRKRGLWPRPSAGGATT